MPTPAHVTAAAAEADSALQALAATANQPPAPADVPPAPPAPPAAPAPAPAANDVPPPAPAAPAPAAAPVDPQTELQRLYSLLSTEQGRRAQQDAEIAQLTGRLQQMTEQLRQPAPAPATPAPSLITDADRTDFGADMIDFVQRVVREEVGGTLRTVLTKIGNIEAGLQRAATAATHAQKSAEDLAVERYFAQLDQTVPGWRVTNDDPQFLAWLQNRDTFSRKPRQELLSSAHAEADAQTVSEFFKAYWQETGNVPAQQPAPAPAPAPTPPAAPAPVVDPATLVAPSAAPAAAPTLNPANGKIWTEAEITQVYDDRVKGRITPTKFAELEREIQQAVLDGRVR